MREIKFRAYIPDAEWKDEDMFYQEDQYLSSFLTRIYSSFGVNHPSRLKFDVEEILTQYTGFKDSKDVEIYEGDIIKITGDKITVDFICSIIFEDGSFGIKTEFSFIPLCQWTLLKECEVIGNIYENKELLK